MAFRLIRLSSHYIHRRSSRLAALILLAAVLEVGAAAGMAYVAGFSAVHAVIGRVSWAWIGAVVGGIAVSFLGYFFAYRGIYHVNDGPRLSSRQMRAVVTGGFGGFLAHGGAALDDYALRAAGADERDATVRVSALGGMEHGVVAVIATGAAIVVLAQGLRQPPADFSIPWAVLPVPGFLLAFWAAERYRDRWHNGSGWRSNMAIFLDAVRLNRYLFLRPHSHGPAVLGMALFWLADAFGMWAALSAFGFRMNAAALFIGYATGMLFTRRTGPLAGAGVLMVILPLTIWYSGAPLAVAVIAVFAYRAVSLWVPMPFCLASLPTLREMGKPGTPHAETPAESSEIALHRTEA